GNARAAADFGRRAGAAGNRAAAVVGDDPAVGSLWTGGGRTAADVVGAAGGATEAHAAAHGLATVVDERTACRRGWAWIARNADVGCGVARSVRFRLLGW